MSLKCLKKAMPSPQEATCGLSCVSHSAASNVLRCSSMKYSLTQSSLQSFIESSCGQRRHDPSLDISRPSAQPLLPLLLVAWFHSSWPNRHWMSFSSLPSWHLRLHKKGEGLPTTNPPIRHLSKFATSSILLHCLLPGHPSATILLPQRTRVHMGSTKKDSVRAAKYLPPPLRPSLLRS